MNLYCETYSNNNMLQKKFIKAQGTLYKTYLYNKLNLYCKTYSNNNTLQKKFIKAQRTLSKTHLYNHR